MEELHEMQLQSLMELTFVYRKALFQDIIKELQDEMKLSKTQIMTLIFMHMGEICTMSDIADRLIMENSSITTVIANLTERGYMEKQINENDRRKAQLVLTNEGKAVAAYIYEKYINSVICMINVLTDEECEAFLYHIKGLCVLSKQILKGKGDQRGV